MWRMSKGRNLRCAGCRAVVSVTAGTIFADTRLPLTSWFAAAWHVCSQKPGVSALGLERALGLGSYETAWSLLHKLRRAMVRPGRDLLAGELELDEGRAPVLLRLAVEGQRVAVAAEHAGRELVESPRVADLALGDRGEGDILLQERGDAGPLGITPAEDELVVGEGEDCLDQRARRCLRAHEPPAA